jgi:hypothetical protein
MWQMIMENEVSLIIMLCPEIEGDKVNINLLITMCVLGDVCQVL